MAVPVVVLDANVLFPAPLRDLLIRLAIGGLIRAHWTDAILDEVFRNILRTRPDLTAARLERTRKLMNESVRGVRVTGFERHIDALELPDIDDRHVLAAAIEARADHIVTWNLKDFPPATLEQHNVTAITPDELGMSLLEIAPGGVAATLERQRSALKNPPMTREDLLTVLEGNGLSGTVRKLRDTFPTVD